MSVSYLDKETFRWARDQYAVSWRALPKTFSWARQVQVPQQLNDSDCARSIAKLGMKIQGIRYPEGKMFRRIVNTRRTGIDMEPLERCLKELGIACEAYVGLSAGVVIDELARSNDLWLFAHQMLAGTYNQYRKGLSGHYALLSHVSTGQKNTPDILWTADSGLIDPRWGRIPATVLDGIWFDRLISEPNTIIEGWGMRIGMKKNW